MGDKVSSSVQQGERTFRRRVSLLIKLDRRGKPVQKWLSIYSSRVIANGALDAAFSSSFLSGIYNIYVYIYIVYTVVVAMSYRYHWLFELLCPERSNGDPAWPEDDPRMQIAPSGLVRLFYGSGHTGRVLRCFSSLLATLRVFIARQIATRDQRPSNRLLPRFLSFLWISFFFLTKIQETGHVWRLVSHLHREPVLVILWPWYIIDISQVHQWLSTSSLMGHKNPIKLSSIRQIQTAVARAKWIVKRR